MLVHSYQLNPCRCGSSQTPDLDSDNMMPCWGVKCYACGQFQHGPNWDAAGAVKKWNVENSLEQIRANKLDTLGI